MKLAVESHSVSHTIDLLSIETADSLNDARSGTNNYVIYEAEDNLSRDEVNGLIKYEAKIVLNRIWKDYDEREDHLIKVPAFIKSSIDSGATDANLRHYLHNKYYNTNDASFDWKNTQRICDQVRGNPAGGGIKTITTILDTSDQAIDSQIKSVEEIMVCNAEIVDDTVPTVPALWVSSSDSDSVRSVNDDESAEHAAKLRDNAKQELKQIITIESGIDYLNKMKMIEVYARKVTKDTALMNQVAVQKIRTQRLLGQLLRGDNGIVRGNAAGSNGREIVKLKPTTLQNYGLTKDQSSAFQKIASIPDEPFNQFIEEAERSPDELTTASVVRFSNSLIERVDRGPIIVDMRRVAQTLMDKYNLEQIGELVLLLQPSRS